MNTRKIKGAVTLAITLAFCGSLTAFAEEKEPAGYHVYDVQEDEVTDSWYGIARGSYLQAGISKLKQGKLGYAICSGTTLAHHDSDELYVRIYLDESDNGTDGWGTIDYWTGRAYNNSYVMVNSDDYRVTRDKYYRVKGAHSVFQGDVVETTTTCTNALFFD